MVRKLHIPDKEVRDPLPDDVRKRDVEPVKEVTDDDIPDWLRDDVEDDY